MFIKKTMSFRTKEEMKTLLRHAPTAILLDTLISRLQSMALIGDTKLHKWAFDILESNYFQNLKEVLYIFFKKIYYQNNNTIMCNKILKTGRYRWMFYDTQKFRVVNLFMDDIYYPSYHDECDCYLNASNARISEMIDQLSYRIWKLADHIQKCIKIINVHGFCYYGKCTQIEIDKLDEFLKIKQNLNNLCDEALQYEKQK